MLAIDSLFSSNLFDQLRTIISMPHSRDTPTPSPTGRNLEFKTQGPSAPFTLAKMTNQGQRSSVWPPRKMLTPDQRARLRLTRPERGSLYDIMHEHVGRALYVLPICWTDFHIQALGVQFLESPTIETPVPDYIPGRWLEPSHLAKTITKELHTLVRDNYQLISRTRAMKFIMNQFFPDTLSHADSDIDLDMYFGQRVFRKAVRVHCLWKSPRAGEHSFDSTTTMPSTDLGGRSPSPGVASDVGPNKPILAYLSRRTLAVNRHYLYRVSHGPRDDNANDAVTSLQRLRSKMLVPKNINHDSYIVAAIIAMAQAHFYNDDPSKDYLTQTSRRSNGTRLSIIPPVFRDVKIQIITHDDHNESSPTFLICTATVTAAFLERFMHPNKAPLPQEQMAQGAAGLKIECTPVPFWPILGLKERLAKALGRDIAGEPTFGDPEHIGLWDSLLEPPPAPLPVPVLSSPPRPIPAATAAVRKSLKRTRDRECEQLRPALSEMLNSSFEEDDTTPNSSSEDLDKPILSPDAKRRRTAASTRGSGAAGTTGNSNPLEVC
ncbi:hypothetical protein V8F33_010501 [Rhypophila sp. PSN 637]